MININYVIFYKNPYNFLNIWDKRTEQKAKYRGYLRHLKLGKATYEGHFIKKF